MPRFGAAIAAAGLFAVAIAGAEAAESLVVNGQPRTYVLVKPQRAGPNPTVVLLHGNRGTAEGLARQSGLAQLSNAYGFVAVFPQGRAEAWNRFPAGKESPEAIEFWKSQGGLPDDVGFLKAMLSELARSGISDPARIYIAGISNGGFLALTMVCNEAGLFAGAAILISGMSVREGAECRPAKAIPILFLHAASDVTVPFAGGMLVSGDPRVGKNIFEVWPAARLVDHFRLHNACTGEPERSILPGQRPRQVEVERSSQCAGGPVLAYRVIGANHGNAFADLDVARLLLDFFAGSPAAAAPSVASAASTESTPPLRPALSGVNFIAFRFSDSSGIGTGALRRLTGHEWSLVNTRGQNLTVKSTSESESEIVFYDRSRDLHIKADIPARQLSSRAGNSQVWEVRSEIVSADK